MAYSSLAPSLGLSSMVHEEVDLLSSLSFISAPEIIHKQNPGLPLIPMGSAAARDQSHTPASSHDDSDQRDLGILKDAQSYGRDSSIITRFARRCTACIQ